MMNVFRTRRAATTTDGDSKAMDIDTDKGGMETGRSRRALGDITNAVGGGDSAAVGGVKRDFSTQETYSHASEVVGDRAYMRRDADDIDERDAMNPLLCTDVVMQMYDYFSETEKAYMVNANYMTNQPYINERMRTILVDWLVRTTYKRK
jgi:hypothetical protein